MEFTDDTKREAMSRRGRPPGAVGKITKQAREQARLTGILPHEFLLAIVRGEPVKQVKRLDTETGEIEFTVVYPDLPTRIDAAKASASYFAPKMATVEFTQAMTDDELDATIRELATQAGIGDLAGGESPTGESPDTAGSPHRHRVRIARPGS